jgi:hypothetical protein
LVLGYAAPELAAWASANREAVLRAAEAVETAYMAAVDELAPRLPGGVGAWERARGSVLFYDSEREEHLARPPTTVENVEGWQSRNLDPHGYRSVVALLPVRSLDVANRWVYGFGSANGSLWSMTRLAPSPETPLELASYDIRRMGVDVSQRTGEDGGGGSTMPKVTLGPTSGPSDQRSAPVLLDGKEIGEIVAVKAVRFRPAKHVEFSHVEVTLWEPYDFDATFDAETYGDAAKARQAALAAVRERVSA